MGRNRLIRITLRTVAIALLAFCLLTDPTGVAHYRETFFNDIFKDLVSRNLSRQLAYFVNQYTLLALAIWLVASRFRDSTSPLYQGYGGGLALFCFTQSIVNPILLTISFIVGLLQISHTTEQYPVSIGLFLLHVAGGSAIVAFGVYAAVVVSSVRPGAVRLTKRYLLAALAWAILSFVFVRILLSFADLPSFTKDGVLAMEATKLYVTSIGFAIWYSYFQLSKRVKATYTEG